jgi:hypothetical protein
LDPDDVHRNYVAGGVKRARPKTVWVKPGTSPPPSGQQHPTDASAADDSAGADSSDLTDSDHRPEDGDPDPDADSDEIDEEIPEEISAKKGPGWVSAR